MCGIYTGLFYGKRLATVGHLPKDINKIILVDGIWTIPNKDFLEGTGVSYEKYLNDMEEEYRNEFKRFYKKSEKVRNLINEKGKEIYGKDFEFDIKLLTAKEIIGCMEKTDKEKQYLKRYVDI